MEPETSAPLPSPSSPPMTSSALHFLLSHGYHRAAAALRDDLAARAAADPCLPAPLLPLRTEPSSPFSSSSSSSSDVFLSLVSSPSDLTNPYFLYAADQSKSPAASSDFGTARDYKDPSDASWYDWKNPYPTPEELGSGGGGDPDGDGGFDGSVGPIFDAWVGGEDVAGGGGGGASLLGVASWGNLLEEGEEIRNLDLRLDLPKIGVGAGADRGASDADFCLSHGKRESENLDHTTTEGFADDNELIGDFDLCSHAPKSSQAYGNCSSDLMENEKNSIEIHDHAIATDNRDDQVEDYEEYVSQEKEYGDDEYEVFNLKIIHRKNRTGFEASKDIPVTLNTVIAGRYFVTGYLGSAAFSKVFQAHDLSTGIDVCLKIIKNNKDYLDQSLDEIKLLKFVNKNDPADERHILRLFDYFYHQEHLFIVTELLKANLYVFQRYNQESGGVAYFTLPRIQSIARQCLEALLYLHNLGVIHCDLKPENILIKSYTKCEIKVIDFGSSCFRTDNLCLYLQSRSYRAPEVILGIPYDEKIDIWSLGCILAELYCGNVLFPNDPLAMLLGTIIGILGPIDIEMLNKGQATEKYFTKDFSLFHEDETGKVKHIIPRTSSLARFLGNPDPLFIDFIQFLLQINPERRPTAEEALQHPWLLYHYDL